MRRGCQKATQALAALAVVVWILAPVGVEAHTGTFWFNHPWQGSIQTAGLWLYANFDMNATEQSRIKDAFRQWNDEPPTIWFNYKGLASFEVHCFSGEARNRNIVTWGDLAAPAIARTEPCLEPDDVEMDHFDIIMDTDPLWYTGGSATGIDDNMIDGQVDFWGALTHEYGHGLGFRPEVVP